MQFFTSDIPTISPDEYFTEVRECDYKDEHYSVRDNGAVYRHAREGKKVRKIKFYGHPRTSTDVKEYVRKKSVKRGNKAIRQIRIIKRKRIGYADSLIHRH